MTITVTQSQDGQTVAARSGDLLELKLRENPTTGFRWQVHELNNSIVLENAQFISGSSAVGDAGMRVFTFRAVSPGSTPLQMKLLREWEGDNSITAWFRITINIV